MDMNASNPVVLLFAGQGNPVIGMGADLWDTSAETRRIWDCASDISGLDIRRLCARGPMPRLVQTPVQQIAVTAINIMLYTLYRESAGDISVSAACGHSVGEYSALYAAGVMTLEDLFRIIHFRSTLMHNLSLANKGSMQVVKGIDQAGLAALFTQQGVGAEISCDNSRKQQVIGGSLAALQEGIQVVTQAGLQSSKPGVSGAWHTHLMADGVQPMRDFLTGIDIRPPQFDVLMNVTSLPEKDPQVIRENLSLHLTHTVQWTATLDRLLAHVIPVQFVEISNKAYLLHLLNDFANFRPEMAVHCRK
mgnify:FL=1